MSHALSMFHFAAYGLLNSHLDTDLPLLVYATDRYKE